jgi:hypothetical protein
LHEMRFEHQNWCFFCDFTTSAATLSYEMRFETVFCEFSCSSDNAFGLYVKFFCAEAFV